MISGIMLNISRPGQAVCCWVYCYRLVLFLASVCKMQSKLILKTTMRSDLQPHLRKGRPPKFLLFFSWIVLFYIYLEENHWLQWIYFSTQYTIPLIEYQSSSTPLTTSLAWRSQGWDGGGIILSSIAQLTVVTRHKWDLWRCWDLWSSSSMSIHDLTTLTRSI